MDVEWSCKHCPFQCKKRSRLLHHYNINHYHQGRTSQFPCPHKDCLMSFSQLNSLRAHLAKSHDRKMSSSMAVKCSVCGKLMSALSDLLKHLRRHASMKETVDCPFKDCYFKSCVASTYSAHLSRKYNQQGVENIRCDLQVCERSQSSTDDVLADEVLDDSDLGEDFNSWTSGEVNQSMLAVTEKNLSRLFLKMHVMLHLPTYAVQEIINSLNHIHTISMPLVSSEVKRVLSDNAVDVAVADAVIDCVLNHYPLYRFTCRSPDTTGSLSSVKLRDAFVKNTLPHIEPVEYQLGIQEWANAVHLFMYQF